MGADVRAAAAFGFPDYAHTIPSAPGAVDGTSSALPSGRASDVPASGCADGGGSGNGFVARVRMTVEWFVPLGQARPITQALHSMMVDTRRSHGCIGCSLSTGIRDQGTVRYTEEWESEDDLRRRLEGSSFSNLAALIDEAIEPQLVEFALPGGVRGLDYIEEARRSRG